MIPATVPAHDAQEAARFLSLLDEAAEEFCFRVFDDNEARKDPLLAAKFNGTLAEVWPQLIAKQSRGCGVYVVANAGEQTNDTIYRVRVVFADTDGAPLEPILACGLEPHMVVESSPGKWHVYWLVDGLPTEAFRDIQRNIAARFGTDKSVNDLARVMRLPGLLHMKGEPFLVRIIHESGGQPYSAETIVDHFGTAPADAPSTAAPALGQAVEHDRHADVLKCTLLLASSVRSGSMTRDEALAIMRARRDAGRWSRHVPDDEILRALDGALSKGGTVVAAEVESTALATTLDGAMQPFTTTEIQSAAVPHPHAFASSDGERGYFPDGEVTVVGAPGREGKTTLLAAVAKAMALGHSIAGMAPKCLQAVVIYSAEDDRKQYARKFGALWARLSEPDQARLLANVIVPDLHTPELAAWREIVRLEQRTPKRGPIVDTLIDAINARAKSDCPPGLVIFETASTLSDAEEDNPGHKAMIAALKHVAKCTGVAVVLVHHVSQAASNNLPDLSITAADIRGGTTLVNNARQTFLVVNLGSNANPLPSNDARTVLRSLVAPGESARITALICLDSSKCADPPPVFFRWEDSPPYGPRMVEVTPPSAVAGKSWLATRAAIQGARVEERVEKQLEKGQANVRLVIEAAARLAEDGKQPTAAAVSSACGRSPGWARPFLTRAVAEGELTAMPEKVPRTVGMVDVYRPTNWSPDSSGNPSEAPWEKKE